MTKLKQNPGFTLVEVLVATAIGSLFMIMLSFTFSQLINIRQRITTITSLQKTSDQILLNLSQEARWAKTINSLSANSLDLDSDIERIIYQLNGDSLDKYTATLTGNPSNPYKDEYNEALTPPALKVTQFTVTKRSDNLDRPSFDIQLTITDRSGELSYSNHTAITPRNRFPGAQ